MSEQDGMTEVEVASLGLDRSSNTPVVILREAGGRRLLPIWIGPGEASAIAMELAGIKFARPLTHDLMNTVVRGLGSRLVRVLITKVEDNTYYASLVFQQNGRTLAIDSRPSDSVALALRASAPIYAEDSLLEETSLQVDEADFEDEFSASEWAPEEGEASVDVEEEKKEHLRDYLKRLNPEDFGRFVP